jgi:hypothetical protein
MPPQLHHGLGHDPRALEINEASLGADHPNTILVRDNLASLLGAMQPPPAPS